MLLKLLDKGCRRRSRRGVQFIKIYKNKRLLIVLLQLVGPYRLLVVSCLMLEFVAKKTDLEIYGHAGPFAALFCLITS